MKIHEYVVNKKVVMGYIGDHIRLLIITWLEQTVNRLQKSIVFWNML